MMSLTAEEKASFDKVLEEFSGLTNEEAYVHVFSKRMMKPIHGKIGEFFGCDQRIDMLPALQRLVASVPKSGQVFDVGAGAGDVVDFALNLAPKHTTINIEEPNPVLIQSYLRKLKDYPHLKAGTVYEGILQDCYRGELRERRYPTQPQNLILAIHMIYHLTDFNLPAIDPEGDLIEAVSFLYSLLAPGGSLFIVYADLLNHSNMEAVCGIGAKFFHSRYPQDPAANHLITIYQARNHLLGPHGKIGPMLEKKFPGTQPKLKSEWRMCYFFGESIADIGVLALAAELCPSNKMKFELSKLEYCLDYIVKYPESIGLQKEDRPIPQKGLWRAYEPQVLATITKGA